MLISFLFFFWLFHFIVLQLDISIFNLDRVDKDVDFNCIHGNKFGSLACVTCLTIFRFENVYILQLNSSTRYIIVWIVRLLERFRRREIFNLQPFKLCQFCFKCHHLNLTWWKPDYWKSAPSFSYHASNSRGLLWK